MSGYTALCSVRELPAQGAKGFRFGNTALFCITREGQLYVYRNRCPHFGLPLEWLPDRFLNRSEDRILCARHGALFTIEDGTCIHGPCQGESLQALNFEIRNETLFVET